MKAHLLLLLLLLAALATPVHAGEKLLHLESGDWNIRVANPLTQNPYYQGRRFALTGMAPHLEWRGHRLDAGLVDERDPTQHDHVAGLSDEFDIEGPADYAETKPDGAFLKIGVGLLIRPDSQPYSFSKSYDIVKRPTIRVSQPDPLTIRFEESLLGMKGDPLYEMTTEIFFRDDQLVSRRTLRNTGTKPLRTEFYGHHFLKIGDTPVGPNHSLTWPAQPVPGELRVANPAVRVTTNGLLFTAVPENSYYFHSTPDSTLPANFAVVLSEKNTGTRLTIRTDQGPSRFAIWGTERAICPEPFILITLNPGESKTWSTTYSVER